MSSASSITSRLRSPRKSIFSRPSCSTGFIENWVTVRNTFSPFSSVPASAICSGRMSVSGRSEMTTAAAWIEELRTIPSSPWATSTICLAVPSRSTSRRSGWPGRQAFLEARRAAHDRIRDQLGQPIADPVIVTEHPRGVTGGGAREHLAEGDDLGDRLLAVLLGDVADHALATAHREVHVDIRHRHALGVEEPLEQQVVAQRIDVGDLQAVGDDRAGRRTTARADGDAGVLGVLDEVPDDQEVGVEPHPLDHAELVFGPFLRRRRHRIAVAGAQSPVDERAQVLLSGEPSGRRIARDQLAAELDLDVAAIGDLDRRGDRLGPLGERVRHLLARAQIELVGVEADLRRARASTSSERTAAPRDGDSPRGAGSARRRCRPAGGRPPWRCGRSPRCTCPGSRGRSSAPRSRRCRGRRRPSARGRGRERRRAGRRPGAGRSVDARQPRERDQALRRGRPAGPCRPMACPR